MPRPIMEDRTLWDWIFFIGDSANILKNEGYII